VSEDDGDRSGGTAGGLPHEALAKVPPDGKRALRGAGSALVAIEAVDPTQVGWDRGLYRCWSQGWWWVGAAAFRTQDGGFGARGEWPWWSHRGGGTRWRQHWCGRLGCGS
jgi:hypothetical protein